ncbi:hypothetical protein CBL_09265 [Carabus blaptoides fortunei]
MTEFHVQDMESAVEPPSDRTRRCDVLLRWEQGRITSGKRDRVSLFFIGVTINCSRPGNPGMVGPWMQWKETKRVLYPHCILRVRQFVCPSYLCYYFANRAQSVEDPRQRYFLIVPVYVYKRLRVGVGGHTDGRLCFLDVRPSASKPNPRDAESLRQKSILSLFTPYLGHDNVSFMFTFTSA